MTACVRVSVLAAAVSAVKVALFALGNGAFLASHPASDLAWVYLVLAALAACGAVTLLPALERARPGPALAGLLLAMVAAGPVAGLALGLELAGAPFALLVLAHLYNIASEILLWLVAAAWIPAPELRRATLWICLATAAGGFGGGVGAERLLGCGLSVGLALGTVLTAAFAWLWLRECRRALGDGAAGAGEDDGSSRVVAAGWGAVLRHPLALPLGAASFMLTFVWVLTEFLCLASYQLMGLPAAALARLLAVVYALLQVAEFAAIAVLAAPATRLVPPLWRSLLFPLGALLTLAWLGRNPGELGPTLLAHAHTEAVSNGLFDPVHASNFAAAPLRLQARLRSLADGICYPLGMAAGGVALLLGPSAAGTGIELGSMISTSLVAACLFVAVGAMTGVMIAPSLLNGLGLATEPAPGGSGAALRAARQALAPWIRRTMLRDRLLRARSSARGADVLRRRVEEADRRALRQAFRQARQWDGGGTVRRLETLLDSRSAETRALVIEALLSLRIRRLFEPFLPALRRRY
ncbi:MAG: hypothetical protein U1E52_09245 [Geminicoccaceae bacterium]